LKKIDPTGAGVGGTVGNDVGGGAVGDDVGGCNVGADDGVFEDPVVVVVEVVVVVSDESSSPPLLGFAKQLLFSQIVVI
jgi:hypothetical protein